MLMESNSSGGWDVQLPIVVLSFNTKLHASTGYTPFELLFEREPAQLSVAVKPKDITPYDLHAQVVRKTVEKLRLDAIESSFVVHSKGKHYFDHRRKEVEFAVGDIVLIRV